jgi:hypothetical protein
VAIRLPAAWRDAPRAQAVVAITGAGQCRFKDCVATLGGDGAPKTALVALTDPTGSMMGAAGKPARPGVPAVDLEDAFVRGQGDLVAVRSSRPFRLEMHNALAVLAGSLLAIDGNKADATATGDGVQILLDRVTAHLTQNLVVLRTTPQFPLQVPVRIAEARRCLFAAAEALPLVRVDGPQTEEELKRLLTWAGKQNVYSTSGPVLLWRPLEKTEMPHEYSPARWGVLWGHDDDEPRFTTDVRFAGYPGPRGRQEALPEDFRVVPDAADPDLAGHGAEVERLPRPAGQGGGN